VRNGTVVAVGCIAALLAAASAGSSAANTRFVSKLYGYSIVLHGASAQWSASYAQTPWSAGQIEPDAPAFDTYTGVVSERAFVVGSRRLRAASPTLEKWTSFVISRRPSHCLAAPVRRMSNSRLAGVDARAFTFSCTDGYRVEAATALHGRRGYFVFFASPTSFSPISDARTFTSARRSFRFLRS
jgi:hypothetical protein